jgi:1,4-dihydroxy-2-naphthoate octaprenyltransferase
MLRSSTFRLLRLPFSFFLSPIYFFALAQVNEPDWLHGALIFFILHFLMYPASNGYNSYMDRDTGSIGGLEKPPPPTKELLRVTIILDSLAILLSLIIGPLFTAAMLLYIGASKAYSYRRIRLKRFPFLGYLVVITFQGAVTFWLVYYGSSINKDPWTVPWQGMLVCALLIGGFYPLTQIFQHKQDLDDGVATISYKLGYTGTFIFCAIVYALAWVFMAQFFIQNGEEKKLWLVAFFFIPVVIYFVYWFVKVYKDPKEANFRNTMRMNWLAAFCTNTSFIILLIWKSFE